LALVFILSDGGEIKFHFQAFINILEGKCNIDDTDANVTVENVLNKGLDCAIDVQRFRGQILAAEKGGDNKKLPYAQKWAKLDGKFEAALKQIWEAKEVKMENVAAGAIV
jgi:hypothetical protein